MTEQESDNQSTDVLWKRGWFVGGLGALALILLGMLLGVAMNDGLSPSTPEAIVSPPSTLPQAQSASTTAFTTTTQQAVPGWESAEAALAAMLQCDVGPCEVEWASDQPFAPDMPGEIAGYMPAGEVTWSDFRVLGDGTASLLTDFPYLLGDCATQVWTARWRSVTGEKLSAAVIPATPDQPFDLPWNPDWGDPPAPSQAGFLAGFGCSQPAWTFTDSDPEFTIISDGVVERQIWLASP